jgi:hypothetical protein
MKKRTASRLWIILVVVIGISLIGCAATGPTASAPVKTRPEMLREAGFKEVVASTPQERAHLKTCPADTLMIQKREGAQCYAFSDPNSNTMYIGDEAAYQRFQAILEKQNQKINEQRIESDPEFWTLWGNKYGGGG